MMPRTRLPIHPAAVVTYNERKALGMWLADQRKNGRPVACYGIWKVLAPQRRAETRVAWKRAQAASVAATRKRPAWCPERTWHAWRTYQRNVCASIPLTVYIDPVRRKEYRRWLGKISTREMAEGLLRRKGLHPNQASRKSTENH